jgi:hypothetical protein
VLSVVSRLKLPDSGTDSSPPSSLSYSVTNTITFAVTIALIRFSEGRLQHMFYIHQAALAIRKSVETVTAYP